MALIDGLVLCRDQGLDGVCVESDSSEVVRMLNDSAHNNWRYAYLCRKVRASLRYNDEVRFIYREQNKVADGLAKAALGQVENEFFSRLDLYLNIQKLMFLDRIGIPSFRSPCKYMYSFSLFRPTKFFNEISWFFNKNHILAKKKVSDKINHRV